MAAKVKRRRAAFEHALECIAAALLVGVFATLAALVVMSYRPDVPAHESARRGWHYKGRHGGWQLPPCRCGRY